MIVAREHLDEFLDYLKNRYGAGLTKSNQDQYISTGVLYRGLIGDRFVVVREFPEPPLPKELPGGIEFFCSDKEFIRELENAWMVVSLAIADRKGEENGV